MRERLVGLALITGMTLAGCAGDSAHTKVEPTEDAAAQAEVGKTIHPAMVEMAEIVLDAFEAKPSDFYELETGTEGAIELSTGNAEDSDDETSTYLYIDLVYNDESEIEPESVQSIVVGHTEPSVSDAGRDHQVTITLEPHAAWIYSMVVDYDHISDTVTENVTQVDTDTRNDVYSDDGDGYVYELIDDDSGSVSMPPMVAAEEAILQAQAMIAELFPAT